MDYSFRCYRLNLVKAVMTLKHACEHSRWFTLLIQFPNKVNSAFGF